MTHALVESAPSPHPDPILATERFHQARHALHEAQQVYLAAEATHTHLRKTERPEIGFLTPAEATGARIALRAVGRDLDVDHFPGVRYAIRPTADGARRLHEADRERIGAAEACNSARERMTAAQATFNATIAALSASDAAVLAHRDDVRDLLGLPTSVPLTDVRDDEAHAIVERHREIAALDGAVASRPTIPFTASVPAQAA